MRKNNILLVDDDTSYIQILSCLIESKGFDVTITTSAINALEILENTKFGMIITDYNMPGMNGITFAMKVREKYPEEHIIMVTGDISPDIVETAAIAGISRILSKPLNITKLLAIIRSSLIVR